MNIIVWLLSYLAFAVVVGALSGTVGTYIYMRRLSGIVGGLAHFSLGPVALTFLISYIAGQNINPFIVTLVFMLVIAFLLPIDGNGIIQSAQEIQILWSIGMGIGVLILFVLPGYLSLESFLFGSILTVSKSTMILTTIVTIAVLITEFLFHNRFKFLGLDDSFLTLRGISPLLFHRIQLIIITISINVLLQSIGIYLMLAMLIIPTASVILFVRHTNKIILYAIITSMLGLMLGIVFSFIFNLPTSALTTIIFVLGYGICRIIYKLLNN